MSHLRVHALGGLTIAAGGGRVLPISGSCRPILGYLLTHRQRRVSKVELAETLWADREGENARHCLATALWRLKKSTGTSTCLLTFHGADDVSFNWAAPAWVDALALETRVASLLKRKPEALSRDELRRIERGVRLYHGEYLIGMEQEWAWLERQRLHDLYCGGLFHLTLAYAAAHEWPQVLAWGRRLCREEPLREDVHRLLMLACAHTGNRASALAQYRECQRALATDLGIEPMAETQALYRQLARTTPACPDAGPAVKPPALEQIRLRISRVRRVLATCQSQLDQAVDSLARMQSSQD